MKKIFFIVLMLIALLNFSVYTQDNSLMVIRNKIFNECREMGPLLGNQKDILVVNNMWNSGVMTVSQLDAYFSMVAIFNAVKDKDLTEDPIIYLIRWLNEIKNTNGLNIKTLNGIAYTVEPSTKSHIEKLKSYFNNLNSLIDGELTRVSALQKVSRVKRQK